jgi:hypothetical protein
MVGEHFDGMGEASHVNIRTAPLYMRCFAPTGVALPVDSGVALGN